MIVDILLLKKLNKYYRYLLTFKFALVRRENEMEK